MWWIEKLEDIGFVAENNGFRKGIPKIEEGKDEAFKDMGISADKGEEVCVEDRYGMAKQWIEAKEEGISKDEGEETNNPDSIHLGCVGKFVYLQTSIC